jgi:hypothetical protein
MPTSTVHLLLRCLRPRMRSWSTSASCDRVSVVLWLIVFAGRRHVCQRCLRTSVYNLRRACKTMTYSEKRGPFESPNGETRTAFNQSLHLLSRWNQWTAYSCNKRQSSYSCVVLVACFSCFSFIESYRMHAQITFIIVVFRTSIRWVTNVYVLLPSTIPHDHIHRAANCSGDAMWELSTRLYHVLCVEAD